MEREIVEIDGKKYVVLGVLSPPEYERIVQTEPEGYTRKEIINGALLWLKEYVEPTQTTEG